jgi:hypothetical protein
VEVDYKTQRLTDLKRFFIFTKERFDPLSHFLMLALFLMAHILLALRLELLTVSINSLVLLCLGVVVFFFKLRLYDEIKDYETDLVINPTRPLPRGLVTINEVKRGIEVCLILELILFSQAGLGGLVGIVIASLYSLLMYHEFFIGDLIRPHLTTYATTHTVVTMILSLAIFIGLSNLTFFHLPLECFFFALMSWLLFNIFELGRKTYLPSEEKNQVESYSKVWTRPGAVILVLVHAVIATLLALKIEFYNTQSLPLYLWSIVGLLGLSGLGLMFTKEGVFGKLYRGFSSLYIVLIYSGLTIGLTA